MVGDDKAPEAMNATMEALPRVPASDVKRRGWRGVMWTLREEGAVLVTNHDRPEAVILTAAAYADLLDRAQQSESRVESDLALLRCFLAAPDRTVAVVVRRQHTGWIPYRRGVLGGANDSVVPSVFMEGFDIIARHDRHLPCRWAVSHPSNLCKP